MNALSSNASPEIHGIAASILLLSASTLALIPALAPPANAPQVAAIYPPWWSAAHSLAAASRAGEAAWPGAAPFVVIVRVDSGDTGRRLKLGGAFLLLNQGGGLCGPGKGQTR